MSLPEDIKTIENVQGLEQLIGCMNCAIEDVIRALGDDDNILAIDNWRTFIQTASKPETDKTDAAYMFRTELRATGVHKVVKALWETPELDQVTQMWVRANYTILTTPDDVEEKRSKIFPARYLFLEQEDIKKAWATHLERCGVTFDEEKE